MTTLRTSSGVDLSRAHLVGVGGVGMSAIAALLIDSGHTVSGSDAAASERTGRLGERGARIAVGHRADNLDLLDVGPTAVVVSTAIAADNPELVEAQRRGLPVVRRADALAALMDGYRAVCVAGTHGKTSTSSMLAVALRSAGKDPSFAIGGVSPALGTGAAWGTGELFVAEADESDGSFLSFSPFGAVLTTLEPDHLDFHGTAEAYDAVFDAFVGRIAPDGFLVAGADDPGVQSLLDRVTGRPRTITYGRRPKTDVHICSSTGVGECGSAELDVAGYGRVSVELAVPGRHMLDNAAAVIAVGVGLGIAPQEMATGLAAYPGVGRRFERRGTVGGIRVYDDYAHHPTEVAATIAAARQVAETGRVVVVFQPHLYSRTAAFAADFARELSAADVVVVLDVYGAREAPQPGVTGRLIADAIDDHSTEVHYVAALSDAARTAATATRRGDVIITTGAGDVTTVGPELVDLLGKQRAGDGVAGADQ